MRIKFQSSLLFGALVFAAVAACSAQDEPAPSGGLVCEGLKPGAAPARLLTRVEYDNTVRDLLGDDSRLAAKRFPHENTVLGFDNNADGHMASPLLVDQIMRAAEEISERAVSQNLDKLAPCDFTLRQPDLCGQSFVRSFGKRAFRRPLTGEETSRLDGLFSQSRERYGYSNAVRLTISALLQSPQFLYRIEAYPAPIPDTRAIALGPYELASRLSYFLWDTMPDDELFAAAETNQLQTPEQLEYQVRRMLDDPRARTMVNDFHRQWLSMDRFSAVVRDGSDSSPPDMMDPSDSAAQLAADWRTSLELFLDRVFWDEGGDVNALMTSPTLFVNARMAPLYGVKPPAGDAFEPITVDSGERSGLLTQPALMALLAHPDQGSPIHRGIFVIEQLLCMPIEPPPPGATQMPPDPDPNATTRERFKQHTLAPKCQKCHTKIDGMGFGFENYDQLGRYRSTENGFPVDASGNVVEARDPGLMGPFNGATELSRRLAVSSQVRDCLATQWFRYATGRLETQDDLCSLQQVEQRFAASGGNMKELLVALTLSDAFRFRPPGTQDE